MEIFLAVTLITTTIVLIIDTKEKRQIVLCQQEVPLKKR
jgi:hypothetical protein